MLPFLTQQQHKKEERITGRLLVENVAVSKKRFNLTALDERSYSKKASKNTRSTTKLHVEKRDEFFR